MPPKFKGNCLIRKFQSAISLLPVVRFS